MDEKQKKLLIDSIFRGYPLQIMYVHHREKQVGQLKMMTYEIIDGQQRVNAIYDFFRNLFPLC